MKKKVISIFVSMAMICGMLAGCGSSSTASVSAVSGAAGSTTVSSKTSDASASDAALTTDSVSGKTFAIVAKCAGNPYMDTQSSGFKKVIEAAGATCIIKEPEAATADAQVSMIQSLISQGVSSITISANDENALQSALQDAMTAGIKVSCLDSKVNAASRATFCNQASTEGIGKVLAEAVYDITGGSGQWAILSATSQATNQNAWIDAMKSVMKDDKYKNLELVEVAYGDDEPQKSTDQTQALLSKYPDLKVICSPTTVGMTAAAKVLQDQKSSVKLTGLGLPSEMAEYIGNDDSHSCPYMYLWNPEQLGELSGYTAIALVEGKITGAVGDKFTAGDLGDYTLTDAGDGGSEIILADPMKFDSSNINDWKDVF